MSPGRSELQRRLGLAPRTGGKKAEQRRAAIFAVTCPLCCASPGRPCVAARGTFSKERGGQPLNRFHGERLRAAGF